MGLIHEAIRKGFQAKAEAEALANAPRKIEPTPPF
jgi:hypothetical protein